jgi:hypothetical protein
MDPKELDHYAAYYLPRHGIEEGAFFALMEADHAVVPLLAQAFHAECEPKAKAGILNKSEHRSALPCRK